MKMVNEDDVDNKKDPVKSRIIFVLRLLFSVALLAILWAWVDVNPRHLIPQNRTEVYWMVAAIVLMLVSIVAGSERWQQVCKSLGVQTSSRRLLTHTVAGLFVSNFVPTTIGGDVLRVARLGKEIDNRANAFTTVTFERLSGWMVLPGCIYIGFALEPSLLALGNASYVSLSAATITLIVLLFVIVAAASDAMRRIFGVKWLRWLQTVHEGLNILRKRPGDIIRIIGSGFIYQLILILSFWCCAKSVGIDGFGFRAALAFMPAVLILQVLPLGVGGLGIREWALVLFLGALGVGKDQAVALGLTIYVITLLCSIVGAPALAFGDTKTSAESEYSG